MYNMSIVQAPTQATFNPLYTQFTITGVAVKLIFPENFAGNNPISWCMAYNDIEYWAPGVLTADPNIL